MYLVSAIFIATSLLIAFCGYMIKYQGKLSWLAGYEANEVYDKRRLASWAGNHLLILAAFLFLAGFVGFWSPSIATILFIIAPLVITVKMLMEKKRFLPQ